MTSQWPDNCNANTWQVISNSLDIDFIHGDIHGRPCKNDGSSIKTSHLNSFVIDKLTAIVILDKPGDWPRLVKLSVTLSTKSSNPGSISPWSFCKDGNIKAISPIYTLVLGKSYHHLKTSYHHLKTIILKYVFGTDGKSFAIQMALRCIAGDLLDKVITMDHAMVLWSSIE